MLTHNFNRIPTIFTLTCILICSSMVSTGAARDRHHVVRKTEHEKRKTHLKSSRYYHYRYRHGNFYRVSPLSQIIVGALIGEIILNLPVGHRTFVCNGQPYYYYDGIFYHRQKYGYQIVHAPRVRYLPKHARRVIINDEVYFVDGNQYYCIRGAEYEACSPPVLVNKTHNKTTTIIISNSNGSRTPVELESLGQNQWKGPRGEIYDGLPDDEQLQEGYGF